MPRRTMELGAVFTVVWLAVVVVCVVAGWAVLALIVLLAPAVVWLLGLIYLRVYWQRHPEHRRVGDWFTEEHHIGHW